MSQKKPDLPKLNEDLTWDTVIDGVTIRLREAKLRERAQSISESQDSPSMIESSARLLSIVTQRKNSEGKFEPLEYAELMERGERFFGRLQGAYALGLVALEERTKKLSQPSKNETTPLQRSETSLRP